MAEEGELRVLCLKSKMYRIVTSADSRVCWRVDSRRDIRRSLHWSRKARSTRIFRALHVNR